MALKIDMTEAKDYYIKNDISFTGLSKMFDLNVETIRKRAYSEKWDNLKASYKNSLINSLDQEPAPDIIITYDDIKTEEFLKLRLVTFSRAYNLVNKALINTLPTETTKIKALTDTLIGLENLLNKNIKLEKASIEWDKKHQNW